MRVQVISILRCDFQRNVLLKPAFLFCSASIKAHLLVYFLKHSSYTVKSRFNDLDETSTSGTLNRILVKPKVAILFICGARKHSGLHQGSLNHEGLLNQGLLNLESVYQYFLSLK